LKVLTVYITRTGNTEKVAKKLNKSLGGDIELLTEPMNRKGILGWIRTGRQNAQRSMAVINPMKYDPSEYDLVILASPIWAGSISAPLRTYLVQNSNKLTKTAVFLTNDGGNVEVAWEEVHELLPTNPLVESDLQRSKMASDFDETVQRFLENISGL